MLLDGRLLHQSKIRLMLSSRREMEQVIADAQALAGAAKQQSAPSGAVQHLGLQQTAGVKFAADDKSAKIADQSAKDGAQWKSQSEVALPVVSSSPSHSTAFAPQQTNAPSYQQLFGGDSWKNPQPQLPQNVPPQQLAASGQGSHSQLLFHEQTAPPVSQAAPVPVFPGSTQPSFGGVPPSSLGLLLGSPSKTQQQLPNIPQQPPGFPPPLNVPSQPLQAAGVAQQSQPRPSNPSYAGDGFFNQQPAAGYHNQRFQTPNQPIQAYNQQQNRPTGQAPHHHQAQFGMPNQGPIAGQFRPSRPPFGRRGGAHGGAIQQQFGGATHGVGGFPNAYPESKPMGGAHYQQQQHFQPRQTHYQQRFEGGINGPKRRRSRSPSGPMDPRKRFYQGPSAHGNEFNPSAQFPPNSAAFQSESLVKERVCVQLSNVPYKATFFDVKQYLSTTNAECVKVTRVYQPDRNYSDRWIVEFDNERDARSVIRYHGEINNRTIRTERITARKADEQYAVMEPDDKDRGDKRSSDDPNSRRERGRGERADRDRPRERERDRGTNRSRSPRARNGRGRSNDQSRSEKGAATSSTSSTAAATTTVWAKEERTKPSDEKKEEETDRDKQVKEQQQRQRTAQQQQQLTATDSANPMGPLNLVSNAAVFGAFSFPDNHANNANYRPRPGGASAAQMVTKANEPKPLRAFEFFPSPPSGANTHRPPIPLNHLEGGGGVSSVRQNSPPPTNQQMVSHIPSLIRPASSNNGFWPRPANNALPLGTNRQQLTASSFANSAQVRPSTAAKPSNVPFNASVGSIDTSVGSTAPGLVIQEDYSMDEAESDNDARLHTDSAKTDQMLKTAFESGHQNGIPEQPPLDLLEPDNEPLSLHQVKLSNMDRRAFDSAPNKEFTPHELELRPHLSFLERYREDPNSNSCIRLENVPKMVYAEQLAEFLGVQFDAPYENIARMQNGVLYINLPNEAMATKAAIRNMNILNGHQIAITQLKRAEMADAIRQNMIIIREMYRVSVVARGFPLVTQLNEVVALFERFNLNKDGAEKCTVKPSDTVSTFLLTFASTQDCRDAIRSMNDTQIAGGARIKVFQPTDVSSQSRKA
ncbi:hypothetical protein niasHT_007967 [Heterodera trifolii]|uniref:RRM domain-containing protein n=1 Tax=Heterodera trifolii TaxID=157864 RepID=A0ABD2LZJ5_9BILA